MIERFLLSSDALKLATALKKLLFRSSAPIFNLTLGKKSFFERKSKRGINEREIMITDGKVRVEARLMFSNLFLANQRKTERELSWKILNCFKESLD